MKVTCYYVCCFYCFQFVFSGHPCMFVLEVISCVPALACVYDNILFRVLFSSGRSSSGVLVSVSFLLDWCKSLYFLWVSVQFNMAKTIGLYNNYSIQRVCCSIQVPSMSLFILFLGCVRHAATISR